MKRPGRWPRATVGRYSRMMPDSLWLPDSPVLVPGRQRAVWLAPDGSIDELDLEASRRRLRAVPPPLVCHARAVARRLTLTPFLAHDLLELHAFVRPAVACLPTPRGLARALGLA